MKIKNQYRYVDIMVLFYSIHTMEHRFGMYIFLKPWKLSIQAAEVWLKFLSTSFIVYQFFIPNLQFHIFSKKAIYTCHTIIPALELIQNLYNSDHLNYSFCDLPKLLYHGFSIQLGERKRTMPTVFSKQVLAMLINTFDRVVSSSSYMFFMAILLGKLYLLF